MCWEFGPQFLGKHIIQPTWTLPLSRKQYTSRFQWSGNVMMVLDCKIKQRRDDDSNNYRSRRHVGRRSPFCIVACGEGRFVFICIAIALLGYFW
jgi:hypothetical protein